MTEYQAWVRSLAEGDEVAVLGQLGAVELARVERVNKFSVVAGGRRYLRSGARVGWRSKPRDAQLAPPTPERRAEAERSALVLWLLDVAAEAGRGGSATTTEQLRAMRLAHASPRVVEVARAVETSVDLCTSPDRCSLGIECDGCQVRALASDALDAARRSGA